MDKETPARYQEKDVPLRVELGIGFNWFDYFGSGGYYARWRKYPLDEGLYPDIEDDSAWEELFKGLDALNPGWIRFGIPPNPHVDEAGEPFFETVHIERLKKVDDWAARNGKVIVLDFFSMPAAYEFPVPEGTVEGGDEIINMAAECNRSYAEDFVAPFLKKLLLKFKLSSVRYFNPINEPMAYGVYQTPRGGVPAMAHYVDMIREIRTALDRCGISRDRLKLIGLDSTDPVRHLFEMFALGVDVDPYVDVYALHHYNLRMDHWPAKYTSDSGLRMFDTGLSGIIEREDKYVLDYCRMRGKSLWALEMGSFYHGKFETPEGVASLETVLAVCEGIIRASNLGISAFCLWSLMNTNTVDGHWAVMKVENGKWMPCGYPFLGYGMLCRHFRPGSNIIPIEEESLNRPHHLFGSWAVGEDGCVTALLINDHPDESRQFNLGLIDRLNWKCVKLATLDQRSSNSLSEISRVVENGRVSLELPAYSMTLASVR